MTWADTVRFAARSVLRRPGRAALTVVAVTLAAALFTAMLTMAATAQGRVLDQLAKGGPLAGIQVAAAAPDPSQAGVDNPTRGAPKPIDQAALDRIARLRGVDVVLPIVTAQALVAWPGHGATAGNGVGPTGSGSVTAFAGPSCSTPAASVRIRTWRASLNPSRRSRASSLKRARIRTSSSSSLATRSARILTFAAP